jgi:hypothetical protein
MILNETETTEEALHWITLAWEWKSHSVASGDISEAIGVDFVRLRPDLRQFIGRMKVNA